VCFSEIIGNTPLEPTHNPSNRSLKEKGEIAPLDVLLSVQWFEKIDKLEDERETFKEFSEGCIIKTR